MMPNVSAPEAIEADRADWMRQRELEVVQEIAHVFLTADSPLEVYRLALDRVTPILGASFSSVFLRDPRDATVLKLECAQSWPQSSARYLGQLRLRVGRGPTGRAVAERTVIEVENVQADPLLREWWEPASELGFASLAALPLVVADQAVGALSFYFREPHRFEDEERRLLALTADQLSATWARARLIEELHLANAELQRRNERLAHRVTESESAKRLKDEFLANISHELRTPLTSILGYAYLLSAGQVGALNDRQVAAIAKIDSAGNVLLRLITDLIDLSQLKLGQMELCMAPEDAVRLSERTIQAVGPPPEAVRFELAAPAEGVILVTDGAKAGKVLHNLLANAFKFTSRGSVRLVIRPIEDAAGRWIEWAVRDTGIGIARADLDSIFDEFRQVDGSSTRLYGGTGLGLALSRRLARLLGGDIEAESVPGKGSTFTLRLPVTHPDTV
jgi:signal transduction histidine kinase